MALRTLRLLGISVAYNVQLPRTGQPDGDAGNWPQIELRTAQGEVLVRCNAGGHTLPVTGDVAYIYAMRTTGEYIMPPLTMGPNIYPMLGITVTLRAVQLPNGNGTMQFYVTDGDKNSWEFTL